ncbi:MAG: hypothetical protein JW841_09555 [Deltaproteobacteria bacterium]|nr:hypothetical protein [Deltaproteobacteria bacterium]
MKTILLLSLLITTTAQAERIKIAVLPTQYDKISAKLIPKIFDESVLAGVQNVSNFQVIGQDDIAAMVGFEKQKDIISRSEVSCLANIGGALGVDRVVSVKIARVDEDWLVTTKLINIKNVTVESRTNDLISGDTKELITAINPILAKLFVSLSSFSPTTTSSSSSISTTNQTSAKSNKLVKRFVITDFEQPENRPQLQFYKDPTASTRGIIYTQQLAHNGKWSLKIESEISDYLSVAYNLSPAKANWSDMTTFALWANSKTSYPYFGVELEDAQGEHFTALAKSPFKKWERVTIALSNFSPRKDYQPPESKQNGKIDYPIKNLIFLFNNYYLTEQNYKTNDLSYRYYFTLNIDDIEITNE